MIPVAEMAQKIGAGAVTAASWRGTVSTAQGIVGDLCATPRVRYLMLATFRNR